MILKSFISCSSLELRSSTMNSLILKTNSFTIDMRMIMVENIVERRFIVAFLMLKVSGRDQDKTL